MALFQAEERGTTTSTFVQSGTVRRDEYESRDLLVARLAQRLTQDSAPRLHLLIIMALAGGTGFLSSVLMLWSGVPAFDAMAVRYSAAALSGYAAFIALVRLWIALHRPSHVPGLDLGADVIDAVVRVPGSGTPDVDLSLEVDSRSVGHAATRGAVRDSVLDGGIGGGWDLDLDSFVWLVVAAACAIGGALAIAYVIYIAPVLLAEVALDAAVVSALYRRLRHDEAGHWLTTIFTRTWVPALVLVVFAMMAGFALQQVAPDARSIGGVIRTLSR